MRVSAEEASHLLRQGHVVGIPTETVYGLGASIFNPKAIADIFTLKGRPADNPLIIHLAHPDELLQFIERPLPQLDVLTSTFWPGPLTIVLPVHSEKVHSSVRAGLPTAAFRLPDHPIAKRVLELAGPLAMPSANISGRPSSTSYLHVEEDFGGQFPVVDGGVCRCGLESTILYCTGGHWQVIREGALPRSAFADVLGYTPEAHHPLVENSHLEDGVIGKQKKAKPLCPGQMYRHYAPKAVLKLTNLIPEGGIVVGFNGRSYPNGCTLFSLGDLNNPQDVAHNLYRVLRDLDAKGISEAWVDIDFPNEGILATVHERLRRAST